MPRFFFDLKVGDEGLTCDEDGMVLPNSEAAQIEATRALTALSEEIIEAGQITDSLAVILRDEKGPILQASLDYRPTRLH